MMSDEVTYATLMLQDSARVRSNWDGNNLRKGGKSSDKVKHFIALGMTGVKCLEMWALTLKRRERVQYNPKRERQTVLEGVSRVSVLMRIYGAFKTSVNCIWNQRYEALHCRKKINGYVRDWVWE